MLQQAPDTISFTETATDDSSLELFSLSDNAVGYRLATFDGGVVSADIAKQPVLTISRRPGNSQNGATKYTIKCVCPTFDVLGKVNSQMLISADVVIPNTYANNGGNIQAVLSTVNAFMGADLFANMVRDGSFLR